MGHRYRFLLLVLLAQALFLLNMGLLNRPHRHPSTVVVDVDAQFVAPLEIKADAGSEVIFVRRLNFVGTDVSVAPDNTDGGKTPLLVVEVPGPAAPAGYTVVTSYKVQRAGKANVIVTHRVPMPGAQPYNDTVKVIGR